MRLREYLIPLNVFQEDLDQVLINYGQKSRTNIRPEIFLPVSYEGFLYF